MTSRICSRIQDLVKLWKDPSPENIAKIAIVCSELTSISEGGRLADGIDRDWLARAEILARRAEARLSECMNLQLRSGGYSVEGGHELLAQVSTSGWEG